MTRLSGTDYRLLNDLISSSHATLTAVFVGATAGIGLGTLEAFTRSVPNPRAIVLGRSKTAFAPKLEKLQKLNSNLDLTFIESDVSLLKNVDKACDEIKATVSSVNLLFASVGYINFGARDETEEGLDKCQALRYHTRLRFATNLLPLMCEPFCRIVSVLAGGKESDLDFDDLELRNPGRYSILRAAGSTATMTTLAFEKLAKDHPNVGFIHVYPGIVKTDLLSTSAGTGILAFLMRWIVEPLLGLLSISTQESGERTLCFATSDKFAGPDIKGHDSIRLAKPVVDGCWILDENGKASQNEKILSKLRSEDGETKVWEHTLKEWKRVLG